MVRTAGFLSVLLTAGLVGCGSERESSSRKPAAKPAPPEVKKQTVNTGGLTVLARDENRQSVWEVSGAQSQIELATTGAIRGTLDRVSGRWFSNGKPSGRFEADRARADQQKQDLALSSNVRLSHSESVLAVTSDNVNWLPTIKMVQAKGRVRLVGRGIRGGPFDALWATPDLKTIGTPETFRNDPNMKLLVAPLLAGLAVASPSTISDDRGNMTLRFLTSRLQTVDSSTTQFLITGKPAVGIWKGQGLEMSAPRIEGQAKRSTEGLFVLRKANLTGGVRVQKRGSETVRGKSILRTSVLNSAEAVFTGDEMAGTLVLSGSVRMNSALQDQSQWLEMTGSGGTFKLDLKQGAEQPIREATVTGPITMRLKSQRRAAGGAVEITDVSITGRNLTFNSGAQEIQLTGDVRVSGKGPGVIGTMTADMIRIILDQDGMVREIYSEGAPGEARVREGQ